MVSCLDNLWELIRNPILKAVTRNVDLDEKDDKRILSHQYEAIVQCRDIIKKFFEKLEDFTGEGTRGIAMPEHVKIFLGSLNQIDEKSFSGIIEGARLAKDASGQCGLCAVCKGCSKEFYNILFNKQQLRKVYL